MYERHRLNVRIINVGGPITPSGPAPENILVPKNTETAGSETRGLNTRTLPLSPNNLAM